MYRDPDESENLLASCNNSTEDMVSESVDTELETELSELDCDEIDDMDINKEQFANQDACVDHEVKQERTYDRNQMTTVTSVDESDSETESKSELEPEVESEQKLLFSARSVFRDYDDARDTVFADPFVTIEPVYVSPVTTENPYVPAKDRPTRNEKVVTEKDDKAPKVPLLNIQVKYRNVKEGDFDPLQEKLLPTDKTAREVTFGNIDNQLCELADETQTNVGNRNGSDNKGRNWKLQRSTSHEETFSPVLKELVFGKRPRRSTVSEDRVNWKDQRSVSVQEKFKNVLIEIKEKALVG